MSASLASLSKSFLRALRAENRSLHTLKTYESSVRFFGEWLEAEGREATTDELTRANIRDWLAVLAEDHEPSTVGTRFRGLRRFCGWLVDEDELEANPMATLKQPAERAKPVPVLTDEQLAALLKATSGKSFEDRRDAAILRVLFDTGVRVGELCGMTLDALDLDQAMALIRGKGDKLRPIYFSARSIQALDRYLRMRGAHRHAHLNALWLTQRGALTDDAARDRVRLRGEQAGIEGLHPHMLRHVFAHSFLAAGGQERDLMRLAGWSSPAMLERYGASMADARAREAVKRLGLGDRV